MGLPVIVDIAIGLVFIYLLLSLLASEIQELIATVLQWRAKHLKDSIINLLASDTHSQHSVKKASKLAKQIYQHPLIRDMNQESRGLLPNFFRSVTWLLSGLYRKSAGKTEGEFGDRRSAPSYIPREAFAMALLEQLGTKYFVERLVEAKFSEFVALILEKMDAETVAKSQSDYPKLHKNLQSIEQDFIENRIDLNNAVRSINLKLSTFLKEIEETPANKEHLDELKDWKDRVFVTDDLAQAIKNAGLKPTLQEIVDSIDMSSKTYQTYKKRFERYEQERYQSVLADLIYFQEFLLVFFKGILQEKMTENIQGKSIDAQKDEIQNPDSLSLHKTLDNANADFGEKLEQLKKNLEKLDQRFFQKVTSDSELLRRTKNPISQIDKLILDSLKELENDLPQIKSSGKSTRKLRLGIHAFQEGFLGKNYVSDWKYFLVFRKTIFSSIFTFLIFFGLGLILAISLSGTHDFRDFLISKWGGIVSIICLAAVPFLWLIISRRFFTLPDQENLADDAGKPLAMIFDDYITDKIPLESEKQDPQEEGKKLPEMEQSEVPVLKTVKERWQLIKATQSEALLYDEFKDLGRSFRRYYLRFILENADVDLAFIPNTLKHSLAVLIRRSKAGAKQTGDQISYLKAEIEDWYDRSMNRASGVYRRNAKGISILIGIVLAIGINANSLHILDQLAFDNELRQSLVSSVVETTTNNEGMLSSDGRLDDEFLNNLEQSLDGINLPIGWDPYLIGEEFNCNLPTQTEAISPAQKWKQIILSCLYDQDHISAEMEDKVFFRPTAIASIFLQKPLVGLRNLLGWIITGIAISMGASFWFDLLGKLVKVRNTGSKQPSSPETTDSSDANTSTTNDM